MSEFADILKAKAPLQERITKSKQKLEDLRSASKNHSVLLNERLTIFAAGSLGRLETGDRSDFDVFMVADSEDYAKAKKPSISRLEEYEVFAALIRVNEELQYPKFSGDGRFLKTYELKDLIKATGSPQDDSENLFTARMLLLLESQPITNSALYSLGTTQVVENYFRDGFGRENFHPLFLLNDVLRYWRTLCLNYEVYRNEPARPWLKKNLNLKFSRKLTIYSTVLALLARQGNDANSFMNVCSKTPIERLATALDSIGDSALAAPFDSALTSYEAFLHAKEKADMETKADDTLRENLTSSATSFGEFFYKALNSDRIDADLRRFILI